jgi:hypothetical protein
LPVELQLGSRNVNAGSVPAAAAAVRSVNTPKWLAAAPLMSVALPA